MSVARVDLMQLWRIHIRPSGDDPVLSYGLCLKEKVIGVGWQIKHDSRAPLSVDDYFRLGADTYGEEWGNGRSAVGLLAQMEGGDMVWMRSPQGVYHLCRITGPWEYRDEQKYQDADVVNIRPVDIIDVGISTHVPGKVIACFRPSRTVQRIHDSTALSYSERIWRKLVGEAVSPKSETDDLFSLISSQDCEDLISVYLQWLGWIVYPAQRQADTLAYEFGLRHRHDFREAVVQVKTGWSPVDLGTLPSSVDVAFVFQANGRYIGKHSKAVILGREEVLSFISANPRLVPSTVQIWLD
jgi:hypothetical protein